MSDVCWSCSSPLSKRFCRSCGADSGCPSCGEIALGRFCRSCGFNVSAKRSVPLASPDPTGATVIAAAIPNGSVSPPLAETAADETSEQLDNPSPTRSRRKILVAAVALLVVGLIASAVAFRGQGNEPQEASAASTSTSMEPVQTIPTTTTTTINPAELMAAIRAKCVSARDEEMLSQKTQLRSLGAVTSDPVEISADPLIWTYNVWTQLNGDRSLRGRVECQPDGSVVATYRPV